MRGTAINVVTVLLGTGLGVLAGDRLPDRVRRTVMDVLGLFTIVIGLSQAGQAFGDVLAERLGQAGVLVILGSLLVGALLGEAADLEGRLERGGAWLQRRVQRQAEGAAAGRFVDGFVAASLVFCVGPLTVLGALQDGLSGDYQLLAIKSLLDGFAALAFAAAMGVGVGFSVLTILVVQGGIALGAGIFEGALTEPVVAAMTATGGVLILGIGIRLLDLRRIRVGNLLPAIVVAPVVVALWP